jgi:hypothetical protein
MNEAILLPLLKKQIDPGRVQTKRSCKRDILVKPAPVAITYSYPENGKENSPRRKGKQDKFEV